MFEGYQIDLILSDAGTGAMGADMYPRFTWLKNESNNRPFSFASHVRDYLRYRLKSPNRDTTSESMASFATKHSSAGIPRTVGLAAKAEPALEFPTTGSVYRSEFPESDE